jgi:adenylate kinase
MDSGVIISFELIGKVLGHELAKHPGETMIFDGVPRTIEQKEPFENITKDFVVIFLEIPRDEAIRRIAGRRVCPISGESFLADFPGDINPRTGAKLIVRTDDTPEAVTKRIDTYFENTWPLLDMWRKDGRMVYEVDALGTPEEVYTQLETIIKKYV